MSLSHLALRLAVIEALAPFAQYIAATPVWPTVAQGRVMDSQIEAVPATEAEARTPLIAVYTDDAKTEPYGTSPDVLWSGMETVTLAFEVFVPMVVTVTGPDGLPAQDIAPAAATDSLAEAMLNIIGDQIRYTMRRASMDGPLRHILISVGKMESRSWTDADTALRLSARRFDMECVVRSSGEFNPTETGFDRLPSPLREIAGELLAGSYGHAVCQSISDAITNPFGAFADLNEIRLALNYTRAAGFTAPPSPDAAPTPPVGDGAIKVDLP